MKFTTKRFKEMDVVDRFKCHYMVCTVCVYYILCYVYTWYIYMFIKIDIHMDTPYDADRRK